MNEKFRQTLKWLLDFYLFGNLHISFCAVALALVTRDVFHFYIRHELLVFIFCGTFFGYNIQRLPAAFAKKNIERKFFRHRWNTDYRKLLAATSVIAAGAAIWAYLQLYFRTQLLAIVPAALSIAYAFPVIPGPKRWMQLREIPAAKVFLISIVWAMSCAILPAASDGWPGKGWFTAEIGIWAVIEGLLIFALTVPFDVRDLHYDGTDLYTLPAIFGVKKSLRLAVLGLILSLLLFVFLHFHFGTGNISQLVMYFVWCIISALVILKSRPELHEYFYSLLMDGLILLLWAMTWSAKFS